MSYKQTSSLSEIIPQAAKKFQLEEAVVKYKVIKLWENAVSAFLSNASGMTQAVDFNKGTITVACLSETLAQDIKVFSDHIIKALNRLFGRTVVYNLDLQY